MRNLSLFGWCSVCLLAIAGTSPSIVRADSAGRLIQLTPLARMGAVAVADSIRDRILLVAGSDGSIGFASVYARPLDGSGDWVQIASGAGPNARVYPTVVLDTVHDQLVLFGGRKFLSQGPMYNDVWVLPLGSPAPAWTLVTPAGGPPTARSGAVAVFDPVTAKMFLTGGDGPIGGDAWTLTLGSSPVWERLTVPLDLTTRFLCTAVLDPVRRRLVLFGGLRSTGVTFMNEVWTLPLEAPYEWSRIFTSGSAPSARYRHVAAYDPGHDAMLIHGGTESGGISTDTVWKLSFSGAPAWTSLSVAGTLPGKRDQAAAVFDRGRSRLVLIGGADDTGLLVSRLHALDVSSGANWITLDARNLLGSTLAGQRSIYDPIRDRMLTFGGRLTGEPIIAMPLGVAAPAWTDVASASVQKPSDRIGAAVAYDPIRDRVLVFSGSTNANAGRPYVRDFWAMNASPADQWASLTTSSLRPSSRTGAAMCFDPARDRLIVFGGQDSTSSRNDVWVLPLSGTQAMIWSQLLPAGTPPDVRESAAMVYDPVRDQMIVGGGYSATGSTTRLDDVWTLSLGATPTWSLVLPTGTPPEIGRMPAIYDPIRDRLVLLNVPFDGTWRTWSLELASAHWRIDVLPGDWGAPRSRATMAYDPSRDRALIYGGDGEKRLFFCVDFSEPLLPRLTSAGEAGWNPGANNPVPFTVTNPFPFAQTADWTASDDRHWLAPSTSGSVTIAAHDSSIITVSVPVPDSAAPGVNRVSVHVMLRTTVQPVDASLSLHDGTPTAVLPVANSSDFALAGAWPNPNSSDLAMAFRLPTADPARLELLDLMGRSVRSIEMSHPDRGAHLVPLDPRGDLTGGLYFVRLTQGSLRQVRKVAVVR